MKWFLASVLAGLFLTLGCNQPAPTVVTKSAGITNTYAVRGVIQKIEDATTLRIAHEDIPGYMPAMTMPLSVRNTNEITGLSAGDQITFSMVVTPEEGWIEKLAKVGTGTVVTNVSATRPPMRLVREVDPLKIGDVMPNYVFTNELGRRVELKDFKGSAYAMTFIFTRCPFPNFCPRMTSHFGETLNRLQSAAGVGQNFHFFSISFDPEFDTPATLLRHAKTHGYKPEKWSFLTGAQIDIDAITEQFGLAAAYRDGTFDHTLRTVVIDAAGKVQQIYIGNTWTPEQLTEEMKKAIAAK